MAETERIFDKPNVTEDGGFLFYLSSWSNLPPDQVNYLVCQFAALGLSYPFRTVFHPRKTSPTVRHAIEIIVGSMLWLFCFGRGFLHLMLFATMCLVIMKIFAGMYEHIVVFIVAMTYLAAAHIYRQMYDYVGYTLDITGPLMVMVQKVTSLAFGIHDGRLNDEKLIPEQRRFAVRKFPSLLEYYSYFMCFHGAMLGPFVFYNDYHDFIHGRNLRDKRPVDIIFKKLLMLSVCALLIFYAVPYYQPQILTEPSFFERSFLSKMWLVYLTMVMTRQKYYLGWLLAECVNHNAGLGFNGYDELGRPRWDLIDNVDIIEVEFSLSLKTILDNWNKCSTKWLRYVVYDRVPVQKTMSVFFVSAVWHGFYPGYYVMFSTTAVCVFAARNVRRKIRPYFVNSRTMKVCYDCLTFLFARLALSYASAPFAILELLPSLKLYSSLYYWLHWLALPALLILPLLPSSRGLRDTHPPTPPPHPSHLSKDRKST